VSNKAVAHRLFAVREYLDTQHAHDVWIRQG